MLWLEGGLINADIQKLLSSLKIFPHFFMSGPLHLTSADVYMLWKIGLILRTKSVGFMLHLISVS